MEKNKVMSKESKEALKELNQIRMEEKAEKRKKKLKLLCCILIIVVLFKLLIGTLFIPWRVPNKDKRKYIVSINGQTPMITPEVIRTVPIIPTFLKLKGHWFSSFSTDGPFYVKVPLKEKERILLDVSSYLCQTELDGKIYDMECSEGKKYDYIEKNDVTYQLKIRSDYGEVYYDGDFITDITDYLSTEKYHVIIITGTYGNVKVEIGIHAKIVKSEE